MNATIKTIKKYDPLTVEVEQSPRDDSNASVWANKLFTNEAADQHHGIWQADPGIHANLPGQETVVVLQGRATVTNQAGDSIDVGPGDLVFVDPGEVATWTVHERLRKVFVINT